VETPLSPTEELVGLDLLSHHPHRTVCDDKPSADPQDKSFSDRFLEELFEEGDAARRLIESERRSPEGGKLSLGS
jgi:hypothetical protein